ncbi:mRNA-decapping enzyme subunit 2 [Friedmanniomyces endolithicus]|nr:mRNA-decapping enzyme subunit 2 [Friedmanniomyces endolithicus]KAK1013530.1 mRNA-decapping enzyme subunit 2 [Friedmanniomyces endolithicus]
MASSPTTAVITTLAECLDDLTVRFLLNLPASELSSVPRLCFQVEEAQWFYEDFIRPAALAATGIPLPSLPLRPFCLQLFQHSPLLSGFTDAQHIAAYEEFLAYKVRVPVRGAILLDESMEKLVLVKGWKKGASWSFPRGKINKDEKDLDCAIREVYEETGYNLRAANLIPATESEAKYIDVTMREQHMRLFVFRGVSEETYFEPQTRKEISKIAWYQVRDLPGFTKKVKGGAEQAQHVAGKFYMVAPFLGPLKKWIQQQRRRDEEMEVNSAVQGPAVTRQGVRDKTEIAEDPVVKAAAVDQSAELKTLLRRGAPMASNNAPPAPATTDSGASGSLLSLLRGGPPKATESVPHTPFEHVSTFPLQPESPQPHLLQHPSAGHQQHSVPQFPFGLERLQQQQRNFSIPNPSNFGSSHTGFAQGQPAHVHAHQQHFPQHPQRQNAFMIPQGMNHTAGPSVPKAANLPMPNLSAQSLQLLDAFRSGGGNKVPAQGVTATTGKVQGTARQPSQQQITLLNLFQKSSTTQIPAPATAGTEVEELQSPIEAAASEPTTVAQQGRRRTLNEITRTLPGRLKAKAPAEVSRAVERTVSQAGQPTHNATVQASRASLPGVRRDIPPSQTPLTRQEDAPRTQASETTLQITVPTPEAAAAITQATSSTTRATIPTPQALERPRSRGQLYDPAAPKQSIRNPAQAAHKPEQKTVPIIQRPLLDTAERSPRPSRSPQPKHAAHGRKPSGNVHVAKGTENGTPQPQPQPVFTILARPGSVRTEKSPAMNSDGETADPLKREIRKPAVRAGKASDVQLLRRPESVAPETVQKVAEMVEESASNGVNGPDKREQLLSLFGKELVASSPPMPITSQPPVPASASTAAPAAERKHHTPAPCNTATSSSTAQRSNTATPTPTSTNPMHPPPPPHVHAEKKPVTNVNTATHPRQPSLQNPLLDLFNRPSTSKANSPGTPISPFTLGTPVQRQALASSLSTSSPATSGVSPGSSGPPAQQPNGNGSANGVRVQLGTSATESRKGSGAGTPVETRGFLLGYLKGVVEKEGRKR